MELQIETYSSSLPFELRDNPKPDGVSVIFDNPKMTRSFDSQPPLVLVTVYLVANIDAAAVVAWLLDKLKSKSRTKITCEGASVEISLKGIKVAVDKITYSKNK